jgi:hypothetical protein
MVSKSFVCDTGRARPKRESTCWPSREKSSVGDTACHSCTDDAEPTEGDRGATAGRGLCGGAARGEPAAACGSLAERDKELERTRDADTRGLDGIIEGARSANPGFV